MLASEIWKILRKGVTYCILHGWQGLPEHLLSDLDIVVAPRDLPKLEKALLRVAGGRLVNLTLYKSTGYRFDLAKEGNSIYFIGVDATTDFRYDGRIWFSTDELLRGRRQWNGFWVASPEVEFKYLLVKKILKQDLPRHAGDRLRKLTEEIGQKADEEAERLLGRTWGPQVLEWLRRGEWEALEGNLTTFKKVLKRERLRRDPLNPLRYWGPEILRIWRRWRYPTGLLVTVLGPDGAGKSTLIEGLQREIAGAFRRTTVFHLMPGLLRRKGDGGPVTDPHGKPPRSFFASLLKLAYYWLDYTLGYWLRVRPALVRSTLVLFDRYYDDLLIDPKRYRYGGPMWAARWLRRLIPRPEVFLVLDVPVENLLERKREVEPEELQRQVEAYRRFALNTPNALLLDGSRPPEEVLRQARDVLVDLLHERYLKRRPGWFPKKEEDELVWLSQALGVQIGSGSPTHAYLELPDGRGYLLPLDNARVFRRGLDLYPAQGKKAWLGKKLLRFLAMVGLKAPGLRRVWLEEQEDSILGTLREALGRADLCFAVSLGTPGPHRKPVIQVITPEGEVLAYAKVGWDEATRELVKHETQVLQRLEGQDLPFQIPAVLYSNDAGKRSICLQSPPPREAHPAPQELGERYVAVLTALAQQGVERKRLEETAFWQRIVARVEKLRSTYWRQVLTNAMETAQKQWQGKEVPVHLAHGDFAPWNALGNDRGLYLYDWEYAQEAPAGYDLFHFLVQVGWLVEGREYQNLIEGLLATLANNMAGEGPYWRSVFVEERDTLGLLHLYLLDRLSFFCVVQPYALEKTHRLGKLLLAAQDLGRRVKT